MKCHKKSGVEWWNLIFNGTCCEFFPINSKKITTHPQAIPLANYVTARWNNLGAILGWIETLHPRFGRSNLAAQLDFSWTKPPTTSNARIKCWRISLPVWRAFEPLNKRRWTQLGNHPISAYIFILFNVTCGCFGLRRVFLCVFLVFWGNRNVLLFFEIHQFLEVLLKCGVQISKPSLKLPFLGSWTNSKRRIKWTLEHHPLSVFKIVPQQKTSPPKDAKKTIHPRDWT